MNPSPYSINNPDRAKNMTTLAMAIAALILMGFAIFGPNSKSENPLTNTDQEAYHAVPVRMTVTGIWECLPVKDPTQPHTMECAFGIDEDGTDRHYAVNTQLMSATPIDYPTGTHLRIDGVMTPAEMLSSDIWQKYNMTGILSATTIMRI